MPEINLSATVLRWSINRLKDEGSLSQENHDKLVELSKNVGASVARLIEENRALRGVVRSAAAVLQEAQ